MTTLDLFIYPTKLLEVRQERTFHTLPRQTARSRSLTCMAMDRRQVEDEQRIFRRRMPWPPHGLYLGCFIYQMVWPHLRTQELQSHV
jgi:hypothetical protein